MKRVCVFCGSRPGRNPAYAEAAKALGRAMAERGITLVYGGGHVGLMGIIADAVLEAGGQVIGVIPDFLEARELAQAGLTELMVVPSMHARKARMAELSDAFIAMPGGFGTFEEFCEVLTWGQLHLHTKPHGLLNVAGYYDPLIRLFDQAVEEEFLSAETRELVLEEQEPLALLDRLTAWQRLQPPQPPEEPTILERY